MNRIRAIVNSSFRGYRTNRGGRSSGRRPERMGEITMPQTEIFSKNLDINNIDDMDDYEDIDEFESDFHNLGTVHKMHER